MLASKVDLRRVDPDPALLAAYPRLRPALPGSEMAALRVLRDQAFARFAELGIPTQKVEEWKFSRLLRVINRPMQPAPRELPPQEQLGRWFAGGARARRLIFANGHLLPEVSHIGGLPAGVQVLSLARAIETMPERVADALARLDDGRSLTCLNTALTQSGAWIEVAAGVEVEVPLQLLFVTTHEGEAVMTHPRVILRLGEGAYLHVLEVHAALDSAAVLTNLVVQCELAPGARLVREKLQMGGAATSFVGKTAAWLMAGARLIDNVATLGGGFTRNESELFLEGPGVDALMNGVYMPRSNEHVDTLVRIHHRAGNCHSNQFYKGVIAERAHAAFAGKIIVYRDAQKTDAYQSNNNLLLSDEAEINTKPELEIYADDVKCSHGATVGAIDPEALFYLRTRGLPRPVAESLLVYAFAGEVLERFVDPTLAVLARRGVRARVPGGEAIEPEGLVEHD